MKCPVFSESLAVAFHAAIFSAACDAHISWAISTGHFLEQRHLPWLAPQAHLAMGLPPGEPEGRCTGCSILKVGVLW
jgi:hypothetical protein